MSCAQGNGGWRVKRTTLKRELKTSSHWMPLIWGSWWRSLLATTTRGRLQVGSCPRWVQRLSVVLVPWEGDSGSSGSYISALTFLSRSICLYSSAWACWPTMLPSSYVQDFAHVITFLESPVYPSGLCKEASPYSGPPASLPPMNVYNPACWGHSFDPNLVTYFGLILLYISNIWLSGPS